ncbi:MAG: GAF domain-containing sensor histidine kinase [Myxococcaceae bacterium]|nr:GAF domain-containing sensor histidine kinase [Myxococcaceae bacterium]
MQAWHLRAHRFAKAVGVLCALGGALVLLGWQFGLAELYRIRPGFLVMAPNSAAAFIAGGIALVLVNRQPLRGARRAAVALLAVSAGILGLVTAVEYLTVRNFGIDRLLIPNAEFEHNPELRSSLNAAVVWILLSLAFLLVDYTPRRCPRPTSLLAMFSAFSAVVSLATYLYGAAPRFAIPGFVPTTGLALHSAVLLLLLSVGLVAARPQLGMMAVLTSNDSGGFMARRFLLGAASLPIAGFIVSLGVRFRWFDEVLAESLLAALGAAIATALIVRVGWELNEADAERRRALRELRTHDEQQRFLAGLARELSESLTLQQMLETLTRRIVPAIADWCAVELVGPEGELKHAEIRHRDPALRPVTRALLASVTGPAGLPATFVRALRNDAPVMVRDLDDAALAARVVDPERLARYRTLGMRSYIVFPLRARGRLVGTLNLIASQRNFTDNEFAFGREIARLAAMFADNARLYEDSQRAVGTREEVLAIVSHDLQNPLNAIRLGTGVLAKKIETEPGASHAFRSHLLRTVGTLQRSADRALKLIADLLDFAKYEAGSWTITPQPEHAAELLEELGDMMRPQAADASMYLDLSIDEDLVVRCERARVVQVLGNLVSNAIKFQARGGTVTVRARRDPEGYALFSVRDEGPGILPEDLPHIFDRYWQPDASRRQGTGLGLAIARNIVDAHGGRIWVESQPGRGSTFYVTIPLSDAVPTERHPGTTPLGGEPPHA